MGYPRRFTVHPAAPGFFHCISRCVRRAWLCGDDPLTGRNFDHRRAWIEQRLIDLAESFSVGLFAWAVMNNHTHVVLRIDPTRPQAWTDEEVAYRWARLTRLLTPDPPVQVQARMRRILQHPERLEELRQRLGSLSWFMRFLNECIARQANAEDDCTGRFWEGRFKCQALLDESAVLACMTYVDLNPIRAGMADDLDGSDFTTIQRRRREIATQPDAARAPLQPVVGEHSDEAPGVSVAGYIELVEWTVRIAQPDKREVVEETSPSALADIRGSPDWWSSCVLRIECVFGCAVGTPRSLKARATATGRRWLRGL
jgi:REP element-mobilizing transposase RayT